MNNWLYKNNSDNTARYILGEKGNNPLICIGVNPSTAEPNNLDPTLRNVRNWSKRLGYDGWIMLNLYPQRATNPNELHYKCRLVEYRNRNISAIFKIAHTEKKLAIWAAWGTLIEKRKYLKDCLRDLWYQFPAYQHNWITIGPLSKKGHPHHPLYLSRKSQVSKFDIRGYLRGLEK